MKWQKTGLKIDDTLLISKKAAEAAGAARRRLLLDDDGERKTRLVFLRLHENFSCARHFGDINK